MRIAYLLPMTWACGGVLAPFSQINELLERGHDVDVFAPSSEPIDWFPLRAHVRPFSEAPATGDSHDVVVYVGDTFQTPGFSSVRRKFLLVQGKDHYWIPTARKAALLRAYSDAAFQILAVSRWLEDFVIGECGNAGVHVIGNGVDLERFTPGERSGPPRRLLIEGNFPDINKNVLDALEVASRVRQHENVEVWCMGKRFASPGPLADRVFEDPPQKEIPGIYRQCDVLIKTSLMEGFGLPHLEAMACGCIPATYASGGVLDFCRHDENALVTGVGNVGMMVLHVLRFLNDAGLRRRLRENAVATARSFTWSRVADNLEAAFTAKPAGEKE